MTSSEPHVVVGVPRVDEAFRNHSGFVSIDPVYARFSGVVVDVVQFAAGSSNRNRHGEFTPSERRFIINASLWVPPHSTWKSGHNHSSEKGSTSPSRRRCLSNTTCNCTPLSRSYHSCQRHLRAGILATFSEKKSRKALLAHSCRRSAPESIRSPDPPRSRPGPWRRAAP